MGSDAGSLKKRLGWSPCAPFNAVLTPSTLGLVQDRDSGLQCLIDSGSQVSLWPAPKHYTAPQDKNLQLTAANGLEIPAFSIFNKKVNIQGVLYMSSFVLAKIARPIQGIDFLKHHNMICDFRTCELIHSGRKTPFSMTVAHTQSVHLVNDTSYAIRNVLNEFPEITDVAKATTNTKHGVECHIETVGPPIKSLPRRLNADKQQTARQYFDQMCKAGICRLSHAPWSSNLHMVKKKDGKWRPCGDYRRLNTCTVRDNYPLPHIHDCTARLANATVFSKIDLVKGYHQIPMKKGHESKTAIVTPFGLFEFLRMPFGLKNAAQTFQRMMDVVIKDLQGVFVYLDDILVASERNSICNICGPYAPP